MNKLTHIETLLETVRDDGRLSPEERAARYDMIDDSVKAYVTYHNEAVSQGHSLVLQRFRMDAGQYADYIRRLHEQRKELHKNMIDHTAMLNRLCEEHGVDPIYDGPLDISKGRDDADTRFGVAAFGEELCRDLFRTTHELGVPEKARQAYMDHSRRLVTEGKSWSILQRTLAEADARNAMDASGLQKE